MTVLNKPEVEAIVRADHSDSFSVLGMHTTATGEIVVRTFQPRTLGVQVIDAATGKAAADLTLIHPEGLYEGIVPKRANRFVYRLRLRRWEGDHEIEDPYRFPAVLGEMDVYLLAEGTHLRSYERMGAHIRTLEGIEGTAFTVWAPSARHVAVVGDFNDWDGRVHPMRLQVGCGVWEIFLPGVGEGARYKFEIRGQHGELLPLKADPYAFFAERPPKQASIVVRQPAHKWDDAAWMKRRQEASARNAPISIYEVHLGSWRRVPEEGFRYLTYRELAEQLVPYVKDMGFTHIELLPVSEFPFDGSWGYQPIGLFAPTSRFGTPEDFQYFVDSCHRAGIGVLLDWVPGHFPTDAHGLGEFDGTHLYEHADPRQGFHEDWSTYIYNYGRTEVANFLLNSALFWFDRYHIDGLRVDAVASMLYLDYSRRAGEWIPNEYGGNENLAAIALLRKTNEEAYGQFPGAIMTAEESTAWPAVSRPTYLGGLGFGYKWNMGWMHDTLRYMSKDPVYRPWQHNDMTFGLLYAFTENFILPLSHDEVVHGKRSLLDKMPGDLWQKFANMRAYFAFMWTQPGKKLLFMGGEFGQWNEWDANASLQWHLLEYNEHRGLQRLIRDLNAAYRAIPALHRHDCEPAGFQWVEANDHENSVFAWLRKGDEDDLPVLIASNFTPVPRHGYRLGVPCGGRWVERLNTDATMYGGSGVSNGEAIMASEFATHGQPYCIELTIPPLATVILLPETYGP